jgi:immunoglobulin-like protein involved in spore germination
MRAIRTLAPLAAVVFALAASGCTAGDGAGAGSEDGGGEGAPTSSAPTAGSAGEPGAGGSTPADAQASATFFLRRELGMVDPVAGPFKATGPDTGEVGVHPGAAGEGGQATDGPVTVVSLHRQPEGWAITGTRTSNIEVTSPRPQQAIRSPVRVRGRASAFEGTVQVEVRENRTGKDPTIGSGVVTGSGDGDLGPFEGTVYFDFEAGGAGWVVFLTTSEANGQVLEATMVPVHLP